jgi:hypothetical protein
MTANVMQNLTMICNFGKYLIFLFLIISCKKDPGPDTAGNEDGYYMSYKAGSREYKYKKEEILFIGTVDLFNGIRAIEVYWEMLITVISTGMHLGNTPKL